LVLLGHLHRPQTVANGVWYSGSPLCYGLGELGQDKRILLIRIDPLSLRPPVIESLALAPLRPVRLLRGSLAELLPQSGTDYVYARLTDPLPVHEAFFRLQERFPNLLHVEREITGPLAGGPGGERRRDALAAGILPLITAFLQDMGKAEIPAEWLSLIQEVLQEQLSQAKDGGS